MLPSVTIMWECTMMSCVTNCLTASYRFFLDKLKLFSYSWNSIPLWIPKVNSHVYTSPPLKTLLLLKCSPSLQNLYFWQMNFNIILPFQPSALICFFPWGLLTKLTFQRRMWQHCPIICTTFSTKQEHTVPQWAFKLNSALATA